MYFTTLLAGATAAAGFGQAAAASVSKRGHQHKHFHAREDVALPVAPHRRARLDYLENGIGKRDDTYLTSGDSAKLSSLGTTAGQNSGTNNGAVWIGVDGEFTNTFTNHAGEPLILIAWSSPWITSTQPLVTVSMQPGQNCTLSFASGASGAWSTILADTQLDAAAMVDNTWGEYTMDSTYGTVDVSREVNMGGSYMTIQTPNCDSVFSATESKCVFRCAAGDTSCYTQYELDNCANGSQPGACYGNDPTTGAPSGGCGSMGSSAHLVTILGGSQ